MIRPARRKNLYEEISNQILETISAGTWQEGERIPGEIELAEMFEVSRNSIRESIKALALIGVLRAKSGSGTYVAENAISRIAHLRQSEQPEEVMSLKEIMQARLVMEPGIVKIATETATEEDFAELQGIVDNCYRAYRERDYDFELGFSFHYTLFRIAGNKILLGVVEQLKERLLDVRRDIFFKHTDEKVFLDELNEHQQILSLMKAGNGDEAAGLMTRHIAASLQNLINSEARTKARAGA